MTIIKQIAIISKKGNCKESSPGITVCAQQESKKTLVFMWVLIFFFFFFLGGGQFLCKQF